MVRNSPGRYVTVPEDIKSSSREVADIRSVQNTYTNRLATIGNRLASSFSMFATLPETSSTLQNEVRTIRERFRTLQKELRTIRESYVPSRTVTYHPGEVATINKDVNRGLGWLPPGFGRQGEVLGGSSVREENPLL